MSRKRFHLEEHLEESMVDGLKRRGIDVLTTIDEMRGHLANRGTSHGQPWSMGAVILLEEHQTIPREIGFIKPYNSNYRQQYESWKADGGECGAPSESK